MLQPLHDYVLLKKEKEENEAGFRQPKFCTQKKCF